MTAEERLEILRGFRFTDRQARFLSLVMRHAGVCVPRQYASFAGIANGSKCNAFFARLVRRGFASVTTCVHNCARLYHLHSKRLYYAIGEPNSRYRRAVPVRLGMERLMLLDAVLGSPHLNWLATDAEKAGLAPALGSALMFPVEILERIFAFIETGTFLAETANIRDPEKEVTRHGIAHGVFVGFENRDIALKYLILLDALAYVLLHDKLLTAAL